MIEIIPNWHPIWVHFAIALLISSSCLMFVFGWGSSQARSRENALIVARWTLRLGVITAIGALVTGYFASGSVTHDDVSHANMIVHRNWAIATTIIFVILALIDYMKQNENRVSLPGFVLLVVGTITLAITGLEGAENVYQYGLGVQRLPDVSAHEHSGGEESSPHEHADATSESHESAGQASAQEAHGHEPPPADEPQSVAMDDGHAHSHAAPAVAVEVESTIEGSNHPASLLAKQLSDALALGDVNLLKSIVAPDVLIFESGGVESSLAQYESHHMPADMAFMKAMRRDVITQRVIDSGDSATVVTRARIHGMYKDKEIDLDSTETLLMTRVNEQWKIVHIHWSSS